MSQVASSRAVSDPPFAELRRTEFGRLDAGGHVYLDYTGAGLYARSQLDERLALLHGNIFGNPHSANPTSAACRHREGDAPDSRRPESGPSPIQPLSQTPEAMRCALLSVRVGCECAARESRTPAARRSERERRSRPTAKGD